ncbi:MAG: hypothetical protein AVDCRST_MAG69-90, partial [uncultured Solirubrobacteraceae bacterium]
VAMVRRRRDARDLRSHRRRPASHPRGLRSEFLVSSPGGRAAEPAGRPARRRTRPAPGPGDRHPGRQPHPPRFAARVRHGAVPVGRRSARPGVGRRLRNRLPPPLGDRGRVCRDPRPAAPLAHALRRVGVRRGDRGSSAIRPRPRHGGSDRHAVGSRLVRGRGRMGHAARHRHSRGGALAVRRPGLLHRGARPGSGRPLGAAPGRVGDRPDDVRGPVHDRSPDPARSAAEPVRATVPAAGVAGAVRARNRARLASRPGRGGGARAPRGRRRVGAHGRVRRGVPAPPRDRPRSSGPRRLDRLRPGGLGGVGPRPLRQAHARPCTAGQHGGLHRRGIPAAPGHGGQRRADVRAAARTPRAQLLLRVHPAGLHLPRGGERPRARRHRHRPDRQRGGADRLPGRAVADDSASVSVPLDPSM